MIFPPIFWCYEMSSLRAVWLLVICVSVFVIIIIVQKWFPVIVYPNLSDKNHPLSSELAPINSSLIFLHRKNIFLSIDHLKQSQWMQQLLLYLENLNSNQVILVTANRLFDDILFNWLAVAHLKAQISLSSILILSLDEIICQTLLNYDIKTVCVDKHKVLRSSAVLHTSLSHVWIIRCMIVRLLNNWGYNVLMFDLDAVLMKDPRPLFEKYKESDIIGSQGRYPFQLSRAWGVTLCMGAVLFRNTLSTGKCFIVDTIQRYTAHVIT